MVMKENRTQSTTDDTARVVKELIHHSMYESSKILVKQFDKIGEKLTNVVEDFQKKQLSRNSRVESEIYQTLEVETTQGITTEIEVGIEETTEITTGIEVEIEKKVETTAEIEIEVEIEIDLTQEMEEGINQNLV